MRLTGYSAHITSLVPVERIESSETHFAFVERNREIFTSILSGAVTEPKAASGGVMLDDIVFAVIGGWTYLIHRSRTRPESNLVAGEFL